MPVPERRERFDRVREAMERVRSGQSDREEIDLPSGDKVIIHRDEGLPSKIRIQTPGRHSPHALGDRRPGATSAEISTAADRTRPRGSADEAVPLEIGGATRQGPDGGEAGGSDGGGLQIGISFRAQAFGPGEERPLDYPVDLPFVPHSTATISTFGSEDGVQEARNVAWMKLSDPDSAMKEIEAQLRGSGWKEADSPRGPPYLGRIRTSLFTRQRVERVVALIAFGEFSQIMLFERRGH
jgi:hypothetical protein